MCLIISYNFQGIDVSKLSVPVIGGHSGVTIIPCLSQTTPPCKFGEEEAKKLTARIQDAGTEVVKAKAGGVSIFYCVSAFLGLSGVSETLWKLIRSFVFVAKLATVSNCGIARCGLLVSVKFVYNCVRSVTCCLLGFCYTVDGRSWCTICRWFVESSERRKEREICLCGF